MVRDVFTSARCPCLKSEKAVAVIDVSEITDYLYIASRLDLSHLEELRVLNVDLIISMIGGECPPKMLGRPPVRLIWLRAYDTFITPIPLDRLRIGVEAALPVIKAGGRVLVYCRGGRRRSVTMAASILIALGKTADEAVDMIKAARAAADPTRWYVHRRIRSFEKFWRESNPFIHEGDNR
jgi:rhodanese-related sulfurtransferase